MFKRYECGQPKWAKQNSVTQYVRKELSDDTWPESVIGEGGKGLG